MAYKLKKKNRQEKNVEYLENKDFDRLLVNNTPFITALAKTFHQPEHQADLFQVGSIGLFKAFNSFNQDNGVLFLSYAKHCILNEMKEFLRVNANTVRTPIKLIRANESPKPCLSLNTPVGDEGSILEDFIASDEPEDLSAKEPLRNAINRIKDDVVRDIIYMAYGMGDYSRPYTLLEIAAKYNYSRENIRLKIIKGLTVLKNDNRLKQDL